MPAAGRPCGRSAWPSRWRRRRELDRDLERRAALAGRVRAAARLSEHRQVIRLAHWGGLSLREIAERSGVPIGTVKSRVYYALRSLRLILDEMEVER